MRWRGAGAHALCVLAVAGAVAYLYGDLLDRHAFLSHELFFPYIRTHEVVEEFRSGHVPQVFGDAIWGAGYAFPRFYPPFSLWLSAGLALLVRDTCLGVNLAFFLSALASGIAMYAAVVWIVGDRRLAVASALVYVSMPYRFVDIFARGALAEAWTFAWYPLIVAGLWRAVTRRVVPWYLPVAVGGLVLTHNITALYFLAFCAGFTLLAWAWHGWPSAMLPALGLLLGVGLALWFVLPQQYYLGSVWVSDPQFMWADAAHVDAHRVMPQQLFYTLKAWWFGESKSPASRDGMSFELGAAQFLLVLIALVFVRARRRGCARRGGRLVSFAWFSLCAWGASVAFVLCPDAFLWALPHQFAYIQFPWRLLATATFFAPLGIALFARAARLSSAATYGLVGAGVVAVAIVPSFERTRWSEPDWTDAELLTTDNLRDSGGLGYTVLGEYLPRDFDIEAYKDDEMDLSRFEAPSILKGDGAIVSWSRSGLDMRAAVTPGGGCEVVFPLIYYDFYRAEGAGGHRLETFSSDGFLGVRVPAGDDSVVITQELTPITDVGFGVSALSAAVVAGCAFAFRRRPRARPRSPEPGSNRRGRPAHDDEARAVEIGA